MRRNVTDSVSERPSAVHCTAAHDEDGAPIKEPGIDDSLTRVYSLHCSKFCNPPPTEGAFEKPRDRNAKARIDARIRRILLGTLGDVKRSGGNISELRIDYGPGCPRVFHATRRTGAATPVRR